MSTSALKEAKEAYEEGFITEEKLIRIKEKIIQGDIDAIYSYGNVNLHYRMIKGKLYFDLADEYFHDIFRVEHYPEWIIRNKRQLRRKMKKRYFELTERQHELLNEFWKRYPDGIITFG